MKLDITQPKSFQDQPLPPNSRLAGWAALVHGLGLRAPVRQPSCISEKYVRGTRRVDGPWLIHDKRFAMEDTLTDHLSFALRHETIDFLVLKTLFKALEPEVLTSFIRATPNGVATRRVWFFYETLMGRDLDLDNAPMVTAVPALDPKRYITGEGRLSTRHRVLDNMPGTGAFCPILRRTRTLEAFIAMDLGGKATATLGRTGASVVARAANFLLLADSRASFEIEGESPRTNRLQRWGRAILEAGKRPLDQAEIHRLHGILIGDDRFTEIGYRSDGVFLGERDMDNDPIPEFIGAKPEDLQDLMGGLEACDRRLRSSGIDPVSQAAMIAFGFVYIHPLADGNGRLHRYLTHHVLAERGFTPPGMVFPVSSVMLDRIDDYRRTLQARTGPLMPHIQWRSLPDKNVDVTNDTADLYRYFDCTEEAEFLHGCVARAIEHDLPKEILFLKSNDQALREIMSLIEMPDRLAQNLIHFIRGNGGKLGKKRRSGIFEKLTDREVSMVEALVTEAFAPYDATFGASS